MLMAMAGRPAAVSDLSGPGKPTLADDPVNDSYSDGVNGPPRSVIGIPVRQELDPPEIRVGKSLALFGSDVESRSDSRRGRARRWCAPGGTRIVDVGVVLIAHQCFDRRAQRHYLDRPGRWSARTR